MACQPCCSSKSTPSGPIPSSWACCHGLRTLPTSSVGGCDRGRDGIRVRRRTSHCPSGRSWHRRLRGQGLPIPSLSGIAERSGSRSSLRSSLGTPTTIWYTRRQASLCRPYWCPARRHAARTSCGGPQPPCSQVSPPANTCSRPRTRTWTCMALSGRSGGGMDARNAVNGWEGCDVPPHDPARTDGADRATPVARHRD